MGLSILKMALVSVHIDSFDQFDNLNSFLHQSLYKVMEICHGEMIDLKGRLSHHNQSIKGEIRKNCQAHNKLKDVKNYLYSIQSKLKYLQDELFSNDFGRTPIYPQEGDTELAGAFINEIKYFFNDVKDYIKEYPQTDISLKGTNTSKKAVGRILILPLSYTLDTMVEEETFNAAFRSLQNNGFITDTTTDDQFIACFSGRAVLAKVRWKKQNALYYFIKQLNQKDLITKIPNGIWETAALCFTDKNEGPLNPRNLGKTKPPKNPVCRKIDDAIVLIRKNT